MTAKDYLDVKTYKIIHHARPGGLVQGSTLEPEAQALLWMIDIAVDVDSVLVQAEQAWKEQSYSQNHYPKLSSRNFPEIFK